MDKMPWSTKVNDVYVKLIDPTGKHTTIISHHRVWDGKLFMANLRLRYEQAENPDDVRTVKLTTQGAYRKFMGYKPEHCNDN